jgi:hypothetical protein
VNAIAPGRRSRTRDSIGAIRHVFLEADHDGPAVLAKVADQSDLPEPSYILHSSPNRVHIFWRVNGFEPEQVEALQKRLASCGARRLPRANDCHAARRVPVRVDVGGRGNGVATLLLTFDRNRCTLRIV